MGKTVMIMKTVNANTKLNFSLIGSIIEDAAITRETLLIKELDLRIEAINNGRQGRVTLNIEGKKIIETDIDTYNDDNRLSWLIKTEYLGYEMPKEDLGFGHLGNGIIVWDCFRGDDDYMNVAHISADGKVEYYEEVSEEGKARIEAFAKNI